MKARPRTLLLIGAISVVLLFVVFPTPILNQFKLMVYANLIPYDLVFDPGFDATKVDGATVIDCLHGSKACPEGVHFKNDETGLIEEREVITGKTIDYALPLTEVQPESTAPQNVIDAAISADNVAYALFGMVLISMVIVVIYTLRKRKHK